MITTVTTVTTVTTIAAMGLTVVIGIAAVVMLLVFLTTKELASNTHSSSSLRTDSMARLARFVSVPILPLVIVFAVIVALAIL